MGYVFMVSLNRGWDLLLAVPANKPGGIPALQFTSGVFLS